MCREGADTQISEMFYRAVVQAVLIFGSESWVLSAYMETVVEGTHKWFLRHIIGKQMRWNPDGTWVIPEAEVVLESVGMQSTATYISRRQGSVSQWVVL